MRFLCDNLRAKTRIFEQWARPLLARVRYLPNISKKNDIENTSNQSSPFETTTSNSNGDKPRHSSDSKNLTKSNYKKPFIIKIEDNETDDEEPYKLQNSPKLINVSNVENASVLQNNDKSSYNVSINEKDTKINDKEIKLKKSFQQK